MGYESLFPLGSGGLGQVALAVRREEGFERLVAIKRLRAHVAGDPRAAEMLREEARIAGLLNSRFTVPVVDVGSDARGPFLVMEYVDGVDLRQLCRELQAQHALPMSIGQACSIGAQAARALEAVHSLEDHRGRALGAVHRDVSPQNILVGFDGSVRLIDLGIAKAEHSLAGETAHGTLKGKPGYMAPEQVQFGELSDRTDIFALGVVVFELLAGERLYRGDLTTACRALLDSEAAPDLSDYIDDPPPALVDLLFRMFSWDASSRPTAREVATVFSAVADAEEHDSLADLLDGTMGPWRSRRSAQIRQALEALPPLETTTRSTTPTLQRSSPDRRLAFAVVMLGVLVGTVSAAAYWLGQNDSQVETQVDIGPSTATPRAELATAREEPRADSPEPTPLPENDEPEAEAAPPADSADSEDMSSNRRRRRRPRTMRASAMSSDGVELMDWVE